MTQLQKRIISALILIPLTLAFLYYGSWPLIAVIVIVSLIAMWEWASLSRKTKYIWPAFIVGAVYIPLAAYGFYFMARDSDGFFNVAIFFIIALWASDIGAYAAGKFIGGKKLLPKISPNKTWSGLVGGFICSGLISASITSVIIATHVVYEINVKEIIYTSINIAPFGFIMGGITGLLGQAGDLLVSFLKRKANAKDAGDIIPGHGGILDRVDSMLFPCAIFAIWVMIAS